VSHDGRMAPPDGAATILDLHTWRDRAVLGVVLAAFAAGFGQFGVVAALGDVAREFGRITHGASLADQAGLSGTVLGAGLAVIRLSSLLALALTGMADRVGRRTMLLGTVTVGLVITVASAVSPGYWWFVVVFALGRPFLSATNALAQVIAAEQTSALDRAKAVAFVAAGYGVGAGLTAVVHSLASSSLGFRWIVALAAVPLLVVPVIARWVTEPDRFTAAEEAPDRPMPVLGAVAPRFRRRLAVVVTVAFAISLITGPANTFVFLYAQNVRHLSGVETAAMVVGAGVAGLGGLLLGRWLADRYGRRPTGALGMVGIAGFATLTYSGGTWALVLGYVLGILSGSVFAPAAGALVNELFPTSVRASVSGWWLVAGVLGASGGLVGFGAVADAGERFGQAAMVTFLPAALAAALFWCVPETRGREPEDMWPAQ
jgi:MFS family permease